MSRWTTRSRTVQPAHRLGVRHWSASRPSSTVSSRSRSRRTRRSTSSSVAVIRCPSRRTARRGRLVRLSGVVTPGGGQTHHRSPCPLGIASCRTGLGQASRRLPSVRTVRGTGPVENWDAVLVGGGVMSATLGVLLAHAEPDRRVLVVERLDEAGCESSAAENNAGTGHAGLCEFNYTPRRPDGTVDPSAALLIAEQFATSLVFWA